jgi:hypothetical protein
MKKMSGKVEKITSWKQLIEKPKVGSVTLTWPDGSQGTLEVKGLSNSIIEGINEKWDAKKPSQPSVPTNVPGKGPKLVPVTDGTEYEKWKAECDAIDNIKVAHTALEFMALKPEPADGLTGDDAIKDQIKQLKDNLLIGHFAEIIKAGYMASGINMDFDKVEDAKNSL